MVYNTAFIERLTGLYIGVCAVHCVACTGLYIALYCFGVIRCIVCGCALRLVCFPVCQGTTVLYLFMFYTKSRKKLYSRKKPYFDRRAVLIC